MSCKNCDEAQEGNQTAYYRIQNANVEVRACYEHITEFFKSLNNAREQEEFARWLSEKQPKVYQQLIALRENYEREREDKAY
jgi:hypothetical protein